MKLKIVFVVFFLHFYFTTTIGQIKCSDPDVNVFKTISKLDRRDININVYNREWQMRRDLKTVRSTNARRFVEGVNGGGK